jgi:hypothetical protein
MMSNQHTILSKLTNAKRDDTLIAHYYFRNNEMQSEVSKSELDCTMGLRLDMKRNRNFYFQLLTVTNLHIRRALKMHKR